MFIGHVAVGLASKRLAPERSLAWLLAAPMFLDLVWPIFVIAGVERVSLIPDAPTPFLRLDLAHYPYSHSLLLSLIWSALYAAVVLVVTRDRRGALVVGAGVFSHWVLDFVTHRPDMPLYPGGSARLGLGLWYSTAGTIATEVTMFVVAIVLYLSATWARGRWGHVSLWSLLMTFAFLYVAAIVLPPPPSGAMVAYGALASWIVVPWAMWIEHTRGGT